jgi:hypothetical protein
VAALSFGREIDMETPARATAHEAAARKLSALEDDPDWCGHRLISRRTWECADCDRPVKPETRARMESLSSIAPDGHLWVLVSYSAKVYHEDATEAAMVEGVFHDYRTIPAAFVRSGQDSAQGVRDEIAKLHIYQGAYNTDWFQAWDETVAEGDAATAAYELRLVEVDTIF